MTLGVGGVVGATSDFTGRSLGVSCWGLGGSGTLGDSGISLGTSTGVLGVSGISLGMSVGNLGASTFGFCNSTVGLGVATGVVGSRGVGG